MALAVRITTELAVENHGGIYMLVLKRKVEQSILIGKNTTITVRQVKGQTVTLTISAPNSVEIQRTELLKNKPNEATNGKR